MPTAKRLVIFVSDNHSRAVAACYGHPVVKTPHIDEIARRGTRFANAYTISPLCCPARAAMATQARRCFLERYEISNAALSVTQTIRAAIRQRQLAQTER